MFQVARAVVQRSRNQFVRMYQGGYPAELVFLGDSRVDRNFDFQRIQELTGKVCLNLGLGGNSVRISEVLLQDYVARYGNPELVVVELGHTTVDADSMGEMRIFSYCSANMSRLARSTDPTLAVFESIFKVLRFNSPAFWRLATEAIRTPGSRLMQNEIPQGIVDSWKDGHRVERPIVGENLEALGRICDYADGRGIAMALVIAPSWKTFRMAISNYDEWKSALEAHVGNHRIHDYSTVFFERPQYFSDEMHLNAAGARSFAEKLLQDGIIWSRRETGTLAGTEQGS